MRALRRTHEQHYSVDSHIQGLTGAFVVFGPRLACTTITCQAYTLGIDPAFQRTTFRSAEPARVGQRQQAQRSNTNRHPLFANTQQPCTQNNNERTVLSMCL